MHWRARMDTDRPGMAGTAHVADILHRPPRRTRRQQLALIAAASTTLAAACRGRGSSTEQVSRPLDKAQKDALTWLVWSSDGASRKEAYDAMVKRFGAEFPNVAVTRIAGGGETFEKLITMLASDTRVDVVGTRPDYMAAYMEGPKPLQSHGATTKKDTSVVKEKDHAEGVVEGLSWKGMLYALPVGVYTNNVALNLDLF